MGPSEQVRQRTCWSGRRRTAIAAIGAATTVMGAVALASGAAAKGQGTPVGPYVTHTLVSAQPGSAALRDPAPVTPWGLPSGTDPATPAWVANDVTGNSTLYTGDTPGKPVKKAGLTV